MAFLPAATLEVIKDELNKTGVFSHVALGEPKSAPADNNLVCYYWADSIVQSGTTLNGSVEVYSITIRIHSGLNQEQIERIETEILEAISLVSEALASNFTLDAKIRHIDFGGAHGQPYRVDLGHAEIGGTLYRIADFTVPMVVDDSATYAP